MPASQSKTQWVDMPLLLDWELDWRDESMLVNAYLASAQSLGDYSLDSSTIRQRLVNLLPQKHDNHITLKQRNTLTTADLLFNKSATVSNPRGIFWSNTIARLLEIWNTVLYVWSANDTYTTVTAMGAATDGPGGFTEGINSAGTAYCFVSTVTKSVIVTTASNTTVSDADFPASIIPMPVFLDTYIFVAQQGTRSIYNCAVGDPTAWAASTFINTEEYGGNIVGLARLGTHLVALCENSIEFFRDAGIAAPNSPLVRVAELTSRVGCVNRATIVTHENTIYFAGKDSAGGMGIFKIDERGQIKKISNPSVSFIVSQSADNNGVRGVISTWSVTLASTRPAVAYMIPFHGKWYYSYHCNFGTSSSSASAVQTSFVYDSELNIWLEIMASHRNAGASRTIAGGWPFPFGTYILSSALSSDRSFMMQSAYGGTADNDLAKLGTTDDYETADDTGGPSAAVTTARNIIQWPLTSFGIAGRKNLQGIEISATGNSASAGDFGSSTAFLVHHGRYLTNNVTGYTTFSLLSHAFNPPHGELVHTIRTNLANFNQQWFALVLNMADDRGFDAIRFRITSHIEQ